MTNTQSGREALVDAMGQTLITMWDRIAQDVRDLLMRQVVIRLEMNGIDASRDGIERALSELHGRCFERGHG